MISKNLLTIGAVSRSAGVAVSTVRFYDKIGMVPTVQRIGGKRHFDQDSVQRLSFIRHGKSLGLSLEEIRTMLDDHNGGWHDLVDRKIVEMTELRDSYTRMISRLTAIKGCGCTDAVACAGAGNLTDNKAVKGIDH